MTQPIHLLIPFQPNIPFEQNKNFKKKQKLYKIRSSKLTKFRNEAKAFSSLAKLASTRKHLHDLEISRQKKSDS